MRRPGRGLIRWGIVLIVAAIVILLAGVAWSVSTFDMKQVVMPGSVEFQLDSPGTVNLGYEPTSVVEGVDYASPEEPTMTLRLESLDGGEDGRIEPPDFSAKYSMFGRRGRMIGRADLEAGRWRFVGDAPPGDSRSAVYSYGTFTVFGVVVPVLVAALVTAVVGPVGLGCLVVGIIVRLRAGNRVSSPSEG